MSKQLDKLVASDNRFHEWFKDEDGYWLYLKPGYIFTDMECGTCREDTVKDVLATVRGGIEKQEEEREFYYSAQGAGYCGCCLEGLVDDSYTLVDREHDHYGLLYCENCGATQDPENVPGHWFSDQSGDELQFTVDYPITQGSSTMTRYDLSVTKYDDGQWLLIINMHGKETRRDIFNNYGIAKSAYMDSVNSFLRNCTTI